MILVPLAPPSEPAHASCLNQCSGLSLKAAAMDFPLLKALSTLWEHPTTSSGPRAEILKKMRSLMKSQ
ncbi:hypothetical protein AGOR_G00215030 [Albula goreensis]|uniref:Uncharacterized protein n=1 Tax=Albula goreensis TaxID=1534307 RepID=A0A8T3CKG1_9TELE|nr:hypothetical protein AGOR_G00215030 [Albula goreensis]